jgi:hypothetical protein
MTWDQYFYEICMETHQWKGGSIHNQIVDIPAPVYSMAERRPIK